MVEESDFYPFGGEIVITDLLQGSQDNPYKFTGQERDPETGNDYMGARYHTSTLGRFLSPDPLLNSGRPWNPQTWNRYTYTLNNPLNLIDPTGLYEWAPSGCKEDDKKCQKNFAKKQEKFRRALKNVEKARDSFKPDTEEYQRLDAARKAYGDEGDANGVSVAFGDLPADVAADVDTQSDAVGNLSFTVTFDMAKQRSSNEFAVNTAHEGTHVSDSLSPFRNSLSDFSFEYRPYQTSAWTAQGLNMSSFTLTGGYEIWNRSWKQVDRRTLMDRAITKFLVEKRKFTETIPHDPLAPQQ